MGENEDPEQQMMFQENCPQIDPKRARFPCCIVWTPLPVISWLIPFVGHMGICREDGVILDFAGPNFVCVDNFAFGAVTRYFQINKNKECSLSHYPSAFQSKDQYRVSSGRHPVTWDDALRKGTQEFQHYAYSLFTCNCHSFVANNLNRLGFQCGGWNVVNLAVFIFLKGQWVSTGAMVMSYLPFLVVCSMGLIRWRHFCSFYFLFRHPSHWLVSACHLLFQRFDPIVTFWLLNIYMFKSYIAQ